VVLVVVALGGLLAAGPAAAQDAVTGPREMRHFWHVFIAYGAAWLLIFGWVLSILRRLRRVEGKLGS
jgi:CcmD family protein